MSIKRLQIAKILSDLEKKMVIVTGPRQVGKTWIAKEVAKSFERTLYLNYDNIEHRKIIDEASFPQNIDLLILDEIHKKSDWKSFVKGIFDVKPNTMRLLLTGSARLSVMQKVGESMAGRFFVHHILPLSVAELGEGGVADSLDALMERSGFPEPFLASNEDASRWHNLYVSSQIRTDVLDFATIDDVQALAYVVEQLRRSVGSPVSYSSIAQNIGKSSETVKRYIQVLSDLYIVFLVRPFSYKINRAILKEPKIYFYNTALIEDTGARLENIVALELLKNVYYEEDMIGVKKTLHYIRTKEQKEVDFLIADGDKPLQLIEVKTSDISISPSLRYFSEKYDIPALQVVKNTSFVEVERDGIRVRNLKDYLQSLMSLG